jgi:ABC-2 type transport system ATP-binding protein
LQIYIIKKKTNVEAILEKIGLDKNEKKQIRFFSKGMLQRLKIGACIILDCKILLLDEPIAGLDEEGIKLFYNFYEEWRKSNKTILIVSHDINWLKKNTDRVLELN